MAPNIPLLSTDRFIVDLPADENAFAIQSGTWKYDYEKMSLDEIRKNIAWDARPRYCAEAFANFSGLKILELGPSDGYNTAGLEAEGATDIISIEANVGAFLRCLILKNALQLQAKFLLGDFLKYIQLSTINPDLIYASGILYHLVDPLSFIMRCGEITPRLFIWSFYYDKEIIEADPFERACFANGETEVKSIKGVEFTLRKRYYRPEIVADPKYAGGVLEYANWLSQEELFACIELAGYRIIRTVHDNHSSVHAYNILAEM